MTNTLPPSMPQEMLERMPKEQQLFFMVQRWFQHYQQAAIELLGQAHADEIQHLTPEQLEKAKREVDPSFKKVPTTLLGANSATVDFISSPRENIVSDRYFRISMNLEADGSPYVPEQLVDKVRSSNGVEILIGPELPPFYALFNDLEKAPPDTNGISGMPDMYLKDLQSKGQEPSWLNEQDIDELFRILPIMQLDPAGVENMNSNLFRPPMPPTTNLAD